MYQILAFINERNTHNSLAKAADIRLERILNYIERNLKQPFSIPKLALIQATSVEYFRHWFKTMTKFSANKYISKKHVNRACKLLVTTHRNIETIDLYCGDKDPLHCLKERISIPLRDDRRRQKKDPFSPHN